jgi:hypothetical protein
MSETLTRSRAFHIRHREHLLRTEKVNAMLRRTRKPFDPEAVGAALADALGPDRLAMLAEVIGRYTEEARSG